MTTRIKGTSQSQLYPRRFNPTSNYFAYGQQMPAQLQEVIFGRRFAGGEEELRLAYTIDELPVRGGEVSEPTWATMVDRDVAWKELPRVWAARWLTKYKSAPVRTRAIATWLVPTG